MNQDAKSAENGKSTDSPAPASGFSRLINIQELSPDERRSVLEDLFVFGKSNQAPFLVRQAILLVLSTVIATAGLISDSAAVVIGAMLVAPLMNPVMAAAGAVVMGWPRRFYEAIFLLTAMAVGALAISSVLTLISPELLIMPAQVLARTKPTFWDLLIALAAGSAGAYTITRKESSAIPGVAVAVALLPPLASTGILTTTYLVSANIEPDLAVRSLVLFLTNFVAMVLAGALTFFAVGVSPAAARRRSSTFIKAKLSLFFALTLMICIPLWFYGNQVLFNADYQAARSEVLQHWLAQNELELVDVEIYPERGRLELELAGPNPPTSAIGDLHDALVAHHDILEPEAFRIDYIWTQRSWGSWPPNEKTASEAAANARTIATEAFFRPWRWVKTDFAQGESTTPEPDDAYLLVIEPQGNVEARANCGRLRGKVRYVRQALEIDFDSAGNLFRRKCRRDVAFQDFISSVQMARTPKPDGENLRLILRDGSGVMTFRRE